MAVKSIARSSSQVSSIAAAMQRFEETLKEKGLRHSHVRDAIALAALKYKGHFEANDLLQQLRADGVKQAHLATIYRTLPLLVEAGIVQPTLLSNAGGHFYEVSFDREHHDHLICTRCDKVIEFHFEAFEVLQQDIAKRFGFSLTSHVHELLGECASCRKTHGASAATRAH